MTENVALFWRLAITRLRQALYTLIATAIFVGAVPALAQESDRLPVYIAGSGNITLDKHIKNLLEESLGDQRDLVFVSDEDVALSGNAPIITIGPRAFSRVRQVNRNAPVLAMLASQDFLKGFATRSPGQVSGIYYDVPLLRQALIGKAILPQATRIALISTTSSAELYDTLIDQLPKYGLEARLFVVDDDKQLIPTLTRALSYGDFLLAAPDSDIYNPRTIKHVLLTAYRRNRIVIGPSQAYVKAGSLASGYAPFPEMVRKAAEYVQEFLKTGTFPEPDYPASFQIEINQQVARSLNIPLDSREEITRAVELLLTKERGQGDE
ncbi:ABC transporter substrate-binding protein [Marinobacter sp.]|uniref:ABC transporter substrate-binding protein n=1 Tax=Marinobacter sp. TaxID=50741 RepID=UPI0025B8C53E|nr:ABC transporter substrate-binding protein [Marinobacter sp.]